MNCFFYIVLYFVYNKMIDNYVRNVILQYCKYVLKKKERENVIIKNK